MQSQALCNRSCSQRSNCSSAANRHGAIALPGEDKQMTANASNRHSHNNCLHKPTVLRACAIQLQCTRESQSHRTKQTADLRTWYATSKKGRWLRCSMTSAMAFHWSCVGSTPVGLCAHPVLGTHPSSNFPRRTVALWLTVLGAVLPVCVSADKSTENKTQRTVMNLHTTIRHYASVQINASVCCIGY